VCDLAIAILRLLLPDRRSGTRINTLNLKTALHSTLTTLHCP